MLPAPGERPLSVSPNSIRSRILKGVSTASPHRYRSCFTQFDPFEDTERPYSHTLRAGSLVSFTQFDPFEDTERSGMRCGAFRCVSPNSIRSRILKDPSCYVYRPDYYCFTQFDPFEDTERHDRLTRGRTASSFTQFDPFEDTERPA